MTNLARTRPEEVARLDALLRAELGSGENRLSPDGDPDANLRPPISRPEEVAKNSPIVVQIPLLKGVLSNLDS